jgi:hypothetical protein
MARLKPRVVPDHEGWFSERCAERFGTTLYRLADGTEVEVTEVTDGGMPLGKWDDLEYVGELVHRLRPGRIGTDPGAYLPEPIEAEYSLYGSYH